MSKGCYYGVNLNRYYGYSQEFRYINSQPKNTVIKPYKKEKMYYIIREDGSSIFSLPYREEFIYHCLICLFNRDINEKFKLLEFAENTLIFNIIPITCKADLILLKN